MITKGQRLGGNTQPGLRSIWIADVSVVPNQSEGEISTGFFSTESGVWYELDCEDTAQWSITYSNETGGRDVVTTLNYQLAANSEQHRQLLRSLLVANKFFIIAEQNDGTRVFLSHTGFSLQTGNVRSDRGELTFVAVDERLPRMVIEFIQTISDRAGTLRVLTIEGKPITINGRKLQVLN